MNNQAKIEKARWTAVLSRDARQDEHFTFAVKTTGIYCRPSCPARRPKRTNTEFFDNPTAAEEAGYRPCKRCLPTGPSLQQRHVTSVQKVCRLIEAVDEILLLSELAEAVDLSPLPLHRQFK